MFNGIFLTLLGFAAPLLIYWLWKWFLVCFSKHCIFIIFFNDFFLVCVGVKNEYTQVREKIHFSFSQLFRTSGPATIIHRYSCLSSCVTPSISHSQISQSWDCNTAVGSCVINEFQLFIWVKPRLIVKLCKSDFTLVIHVLEIFERQISKYLLSTNMHTYTLAICRFLRLFGSIFGLYLTPRIEFYI